MCDHPTLTGWTSASPVPPGRARSPGAGDDLCFDHDDLDELRTRADAGAALNLAGLLAEHGDLVELRIRADVGDWHAAMQLGRLLADRGNLKELRDRAAVGNRHADARLSQVLAEELSEVMTHYP